MSDGRSWRAGRSPEMEPRPQKKTLRYTPDEARHLRRLGSALILHWDELPDRLQDLIVDQAAIVEDESDGPHAPADIEDFIRAVKAVALKDPSPG